jgi:hypothetical protein
MSHPSSSTKMWLWIVSAILALPFSAIPGMAAAQTSTPPSIATDKPRIPGKIGAVQLPMSGSYEPQCGGRPAEFALKPEDVKLLNDRSAFVVQANAFNAHLAAYSAWSDCVVENMRRDLEFVQAAVSDFDTKILAKNDEKLGALAAALQQQSAALTAQANGAKP